MNIPFNSIKNHTPKKIHPFLNSIYRKGAYITSFLYYGNKFECVFCGGHFKKLHHFGNSSSVYLEQKVIGGGFRSNALCPRCHSTDRQRHVALYLKKQN